MKKLVVTILAFLLLIGCSKPIIENEETKTLKVFAQSCAEGYLEINNLYNEDSQYYVSYVNSSEPVYEYYVFCDEKVIAKIQLTYTEEMPYGGLCFGYNDGYIIGEVIEDNSQDIKVDGEKINLNDSIEMNYIKNIEVEKLQLTAEQIDKMDKAAITEASRYISENKLDDDLELISAVVYFATLVASDKETLLIKQSNRFDYILLEDEKPIYVIVIDATTGELSATYEYENYLNIDYDKLDDLEKLFILTGGRNQLFSSVIISDNAYLNNVSLENQISISFIVKKAYQKAFEILDDITKLKEIKSWDD